MTRQPPMTTHTVTLQGGRYRILRRSSRYNILGPHGRVFATYQSAGVAGPRWEELTHTLWPHPGTAYVPGFRLSQLQEPAVLSAKLAPHPAPRRPAFRPKPVGVVSVDLPLMLPAPRIDLAEQIRLMDGIRLDPGRLFDSRTQQALHHEVEYHRPQARWAAHLLKLLDRYEERQRRKQHPARLDPATILAKHIAWQESQAAASP